MSRAKTGATRRRPSPQPPSIQPRRAEQKLVCREALGKGQNRTCSPTFPQPSSQALHQFISHDTEPNATTRCVCTDSPAPDHARAQNTTEIKWLIEGRVLHPWNFDRFRGNCIWPLLPSLRNRIPNACARQERKKWAVNKKRIEHSLLIASQLLDHIFIILLPSPPPLPLKIFDRHIYSLARLQQSCKSKCPGKTDFMCGQRHVPQAPGFHGAI